MLHAALAFVLHMLHLSQVSHNHKVRSLLYLSDVMSQVIWGKAGCVAHTQRDRCGWVVWVGDLPDGLPGRSISSLTVICIIVAI